MFITMIKECLLCYIGLKDPINIVTIIESNIHWTKDNMYTTREVINKCVQLEMMSFVPEYIAGTWRLLQV